MFSPGGTVSEAVLILVLFSENKSFEWDGVIALLFLLTLFFLYSICHAYLNPALHFYSFFHVGEKSKCFSNIHVSFKKHLFAWVHSSTLRLRDLPEVTYQVNDKTPQAATSPFSPAVNIKQIILWIYLIKYIQWLGSYAKQQSNKRVLILPSLPTSACYATLSQRIGGTLGMALWLMLCGDPKEWRK